MGNKLSKNLLILLPFVGLCLSSCTIYDFLYRGSSEPSGEDFSDSSVEFDKTSVGDGLYTSNDFSKTTLRDLGYHRGMDLAPSTGDINVLVLPIEFTDYPFSSATLANVVMALNGKGSEETGYWESVSSFYQKSSFGKLNLNFHLSSAYQTGITAKKALEMNMAYTLNGQDDLINGQKWVNDAVAAYSDPAHPLADFDSDDDGIIDAVIAVYSSPDFSKKSYYFTYGGHTYLDGKGDSNFLWAYTYWCSNQANLASPKANTYVWLSYDFFSQGGVADPHTLIHEYGHAMGLDDYYSNEDTFQPAGGIDMMDMNITDHDVYSKASLGWINPKVVGGDDVTVILRPSQENGDCLLIAPDCYNGTPWDEYILLELYTPTGLNEYDTSHAYPNRPRGYTSTGVKIYHIDSRVIQSKINLRTQTTVSTPYIRDINNADFLANDSYFFIAATNCGKEFNAQQILESNKAYSTDYSLIHLMEASGINTFAKGEAGTNSTLFTSGSSFSLKRFGPRFFPKGSALNSGAAFPYTIEIQSVSSSSAQIRVVKDA